MHACGMNVQRDSTVVVNRGLATTRAGIFAAGDVVLGPASVIEAVSQGNRVARTVDRYLQTGSAEPEVVLPGYEAVEQLYNLDDYAHAKRPGTQSIPVEERRERSKEVELGLPEDTIREECKRCLRCDLEWLQMRHLPTDPKPERVADY